MKEPLLASLADFILALDPQNVPESVKKAARDALVDFVAVATAGHTMPVAQNVYEYVSNRQANTSAIYKANLFGHQEKAETSLAALFNGTSGHALDFDDVSWATIGHPSVVVTPVAIAQAQTLGLNGEAMLMAYIVGVEVAHQIARWTMPALSENGWHTTFANYIFGAAAAAGYLQKLNKEQLINALAIAASRAGGIRSNFGSQTKAFHAGLAAMQGIECVEFAKIGITGKADAIEAVDGYAQCFAKPIDEAKVDIGQFWDLEKVGLVFKQYPCCSGSHPANDVWAEWLNSREVLPEDIDKIEVGVSLLGPRELVCNFPTDAVQAKFSMQYALSARLIFGELSVSTFTNEKVRDPRIVEMMKRIEMSIDPELAKLGFIGTAPAKIKIFLKTGEVVMLENDLAQGNPEKPLSEEQFKVKFMKCVRPITGEQKANDWWNILQNVETATQEDVSALGLV